MSYKGALLKAGLSTTGNNLHAFRGTITAQNIIGKNGNTFYLNESRAGSGNGRTASTAFNDLAEAYAALTADQNDTLVLLNSGSASAIADQLIWAKNYTHFVGWGAPTHMANRTRIFNSGNSTAGNALLKLTATGCIFDNLYLFQGSAEANCGCLEVTGGRNYLSRMHIAGMGHATASAGASSYSLKLNGAEENLFEYCTIGLDTILRTADNVQLLIDGTSLRNLFRKCRFINFSETAGHFLVRFADTSAADRFHEFDSCTWTNFSVNHVTTLTEAFDIPAGMSTNDIYFSGLQSIYGITELDSNDRAGTWISGPATAAASGIGITPTG